MTNYCPHLIICYQNQFNTYPDIYGNPACTIEHEPTGLYCEVLEEFGICCTPDDKRRCAERLNPFHNKSNEV